MEIRSMKFEGVLKLDSGSGIRITKSGAILISSNAKDLEDPELADFEPRFQIFLPGQTACISQKEALQIHKLITMLNESEQE